MHRAVACLAALAGLALAGLALAGLAGCASSSGGGATAVAGDLDTTPRPGLVINLYGDGAVLWDRRHLELTPGRAELTIAPVPAEIVQGSATLVSLTDVTAVRVLAPPRHQPLSPGKTRLIWAMEASISGNNPRDVATHLIEAAYATQAITWRASYELILDPERRRGRLHGVLTIDNRTALDLEATTVRVTSADQAGPEGRPGATSNWFALDRPVTIPAHGAARTPMFERGRAVAATVRLFYDPVGPDLDYHRLRPVVAPGYGIGDPAQRGDGAVYRRLELDRDAPWLRALPAGDLRVRAVAAGGEPDDHEQPARSHTFAPEGDPAVILDPAPEWRARRWQSDFMHDPYARRVVEEIRVKIESRAAEPAVVVVREHLYRGLNWTIAYHNEVTSARKEGPQAVRFEVPVPARGSALLVYRVVYTW